MIADDPKLSEWSMDREIVLSRVIDAPRELVFSAWTNPDHIEKWFGPDAFTIGTLSMDLRQGGEWRFTMTMQDGTCFPNRMRFLRIDAPNLIETTQDDGRDDDEGRFRTTITFDEQSDGKTIVTLRQLHPSREQRQAGIGFGAVELGYQTLAKLACLVASLRS